MQSGTDFLTTCSYLSPYNDSTPPEHSHGGMEERECLKVAIMAKFKFDTFQF